MRNTENDFTNVLNFAKNQERVLKSFDRSIVVLKVAMMRLGEVIENIEENWIFYEILMQHKRMLHKQIDLLISEKMKFKSRI